jgi:alginate O-acetyltransferase complex protein AlgI
MVFTSLAFLVYLPIVIALYFCLPYRHRWWVMLLASYLFYAWWRADYLLIVILLTALDYVAGIAIERSKSVQRKRLCLSLSLAGNLGLLFFFKYFDFVADAVHAALTSLGIACPLPRLDLILPIGISFHTFQAMSYTIDVYRGRIPAEKHPGIFALFVAFFPQLVAGPIERATSLLPQLRENHDFDYEQAVQGLLWITWGFFKKVVIADRLADYVNLVYGDPTGYTGIPVLFATYFFAIQIYCDFSGYTDIAIGCAQIMGIRLGTNFRQPYFATSLTDFWRRWHISLTTWFKEYVYFPLGGNRTTEFRCARNILVVFLLSGLWHGAAWTFVCWGALHGVWMLLEKATGSARDRIRTAILPARWSFLWTAVGLVLTFHAVCLFWVFFRAESMGHAATLLHNLFLPRVTAPWLMLLGRMEFLICLWSVAVLFLVDVVLAGIVPWPALAKPRSWPVMCRWGMYYVSVLAVLLLGNFTGKPFVYFQF